MFEVLLTWYQYSPVCDSDSFILHQTWAASKSGTLLNVSINVAANLQTVPLTLTLFTFDSYADLVAPESVLPIHPL